MKARASGQTAGNDRTQRAPYLLLGWYLLIWLVMAIAPLDRRDWFLENIWR
jgi:hypothetical protein